MDEAARSESVDTVGPNEDDAEAGRAMVLSAGEGPCYSSSEVWEVWVDWNRDNGVRVFEKHVRGVGPQRLEVRT